MASLRWPRPSLRRVGYLSARVALRGGANKDSRQGARAWQILRPLQGAARRNPQANGRAQGLADHRQEEGAGGRNLQLRPRAWPRLLIAGRAGLAIAEQPAKIDALRYRLRSAQPAQPVPLARRAGRTRVARIHNPRSSQVVRRPLVLRTARPGREARDA